MSVQEGKMQALKDALDGEHVGTANTKASVTQKDSGFIGKLNHLLKSTWRFDTGLSRRNLKENERIIHPKMLG